MGASQKRQQRWSGEKILTDSCRVPRRKRNPFVGLRGDQERSAVLSEFDVVEKFECLSATNTEGCLLCQVHLKSNRRLPILQHATVVPVHCLAANRAEINNLAVSRPPETTATRMLLAAFASL